LIEKATPDLVLAAVLQTFVYQLEGRGEADARGIPRRRRAGAKTTQWWTGGLQDLDRADHADRVLEVDAWIGIHGQKPAAQGSDFQLLEFRAQLWVRRDAGQGKPIAQRVDVKHRAALDDRLLAAGGDFVDGCSRTRDVLRRIEGHGRVDKVDHV